MNKTDCIYSFINTLNYIVGKDEVALRKILLSKEKTTINIDKDSIVIGSKFNKLSALCVINSMLNAFCGERIIAVLNDDGKIKRFEVRK